jgi:hypothetical protein
MSESWLTRQTQLIMVIRMSVPSSMFAPAAAMMAAVRIAVCSVVVRIVVTPGMAVV